MGEEVTVSDYDIHGGDDDQRAMDWEIGLPNVDDLPPLSQFLISPELASAFNITPEPHRSMIDVTRASHKTLTTLRYHPKQHLIDKHHKLDDFESFSDDRAEEIVVEGDETVDLIPEGSDSRKLQRVDSGGGSDESTVKTSKRNRLVWTPQLHRRFVEVVAHLGVKNAVPKTIMQLMNVEGLTRENVASHLQKYRLYVKRMHGSSNEGSSKSDNKLFGSTLVTSKGVNGSGGVTYPTKMVHMPYPPPPQMVPNSAGGGNGAYGHRGFEYHSYPYDMMMQPKDCSGNNFGSVSPYQHPMTSNDK